MRIPRFTISIEGDVVLSRTAIWPDSDAPQSDPTSREAQRAIDYYVGDKGLAGFLKDWNLEDRFKVRVVKNP